jgi:replicative DNA helicase
MTEHERSQLYDAALERSYIAALWSDDARAVRKHLGSAERLDPLDCSSRQHVQILAAVHELAATGCEISPLTIRAAFDAKGGTAQVEALDEIFCKHEPRLDSLATMAHRLTSLAHLRRVRSNLSQALESCEQQNLEGAIEHARDAIGEEPRGQIEVATLHSSAVAALAAARPQSGQRLRIVPSGFPLLDDAIKGFLAGGLHILGGRRGSGKSSLMLAMALHQARKLGLKVGIISVEDPREIWGARALAMFSGVDSSQLIGQQLAFDSEPVLERALCELERVGVLMCYRIDRKLPDIRDAFRTLAHQGCGIIYVDYLQAISFDVRTDRKLVIADAAAKLKGEADQAGIPLVLGSQMSRADKRQRFTEPFDDELKETGEIENKAEVIVLLWNSGDDESATAHGKVTKVKWAGRKPRFDIVRNPMSGALTNLAPFTASESYGNGNEQPRKPWQ